MGWYLGDLYIKNWFHWTLLTSHMTLNKVLFFFQDITHHNARLTFRFQQFFLFLKNGVEFSDIWEPYSSFSKAQSSVTAWRVSPFAFMPCVDTVFTLLLLYIPLPAFPPINHIQRMFFIQYLSQYPIFMCLTNTS